MTSRSNTDESLWKDQDEFSLERARDDDAYNFDEIKPKHKKRVTFAEPDKSILYKSNESQLQTIFDEKSEGKENGSIKIFKDKSNDEMEEKQLSESLRSLEEAVFQLKRKLIQSDESLNNIETNSNKCHDILKAQSTTLSNLRLLAIKSQNNNFKGLEAKLCDTRRQIWQRVDQERILGQTIMSIEEFICQMFRDLRDTLSLDREDKDMVDNSLVKAADSREVLYCSLEKVYVGEEASNVIQKSINESMDDIGKVWKIILKILMNEKEY